MDVSRLIRSSKREGDGKIPPVADIKSVGQLVSDDCQVRAKKRINPSAPNRNHQRNWRKYERYERSQHNTVVTPLAVPTEAFSSYCSESACRQRSFERVGDHYSDPVVSVVSNGIAVITANVKYVPIGGIKLACLTTV